MHVLKLSEHLTQPKCALRSKIVLVILSVYKVLGIPV